MLAAEALCIGHLAHVAFHIGGAASQDKIQGILFQGTLHKAERAFVLRVYRIVQRYGIKLFFHELSLPGLDLKKL